MTIIIFNHQWPAKTGFSFEFVIDHFINVYYVNK